MLENIDLTKKVSKAHWNREKTVLENHMFNVARGCWQAKLAVCILFEGWDASGKGRCIKFITERQDPRGFRVEFITAPRTFEKQYPWLRRFWLRLPKYGEITIFHTSWYRRVLTERVEKKMSPEAVATALRDIVDLERGLADDGMVIVKFCLHISKKEQKKRLEKLAKHETIRRYNQALEHRRYKMYDAYLLAAEEMLEQTEAEWAPWHIIGATDSRYTRLTVMQTLIDRLEHALTLRGQPVEMLRDPEAPSPAES